MFRFRINYIRSRIPLRQLSNDSSPDGGVDRVSPPHSVSNLRLFKFGKPLNESQTEKELRLRRIELQEWNHNYWRRNNLEFQKQKTQFIEKEFKDLKDREFKSGVSYDELALFYKRFLDLNHEKHMNYNLYYNYLHFVSNNYLSFLSKREWYKRHTSLLWPSFKVWFIRIRRKLFQTNRK